MSLSLEERDPRLAEIRSSIDDIGERIRAALRVINERSGNGQYYGWDLCYNNLIFWDGA